MRSTHNSRRGSLLLVVLSLLILFTMVGISFVLVAGQYRKGAKAAARHELVGDAPRKQLDQAMYQLLRGTNNPRSALLGHDLLGDMYGAYLVKLDDKSAIPAQITGVTETLGGQLIDLLFTRDMAPELAAHFRDSAGQVLTMIDGPAKGISTRIIESVLPQTARNPTEFFQVRVERFRGSTAAAIPQIGDHFIINDRPFNGAGTGMEPLGGGQFQTLPSNSFPGMPAALLPNFSAGGGDALANAFGEDESWDAADFQNMFLAMVRYDPDQPNEVNPARTIPSLHRPALINYWAKQLELFSPSVPTAEILSPAARNLARQFIARPMPWDHPNFSGSNPALDPARYAPNQVLPAMLSGMLGVAADPNGGPLLSPTGVPLSSWDVDNDGDSVADSIWIDLGLPAQTTLDGRTYKPLFAILCLDLDGRINVNAHGNLAQSELIEPNYFQHPNALFAGGEPQYLPSGLGYGPADISLVNFFGAQEATWLQSGRTDLAAPILGRYGRDGSSPGRPQTTGVPLDEDALSAIKNADGPFGYGNPRDIWGTRWVGLDPLGRPMIRDASARTDAMRTLDDPYEIRLSVSGDSPTSIDQPFTMVELERILRHHDADASQLPDRLLKLAPENLSNARTRASITIDSRDVPVPNDVVSLTERFRQAIEREAQLAGGSFSVDEVLFGDPVKGMLGNLRLYASPEMLRGQKLDLNRRWGNGVDDDGNGVVDEPQEAVDGELVWPHVNHPQAASFAGVPMNHLGGVPGEPVKSARYARQIFARNLYCLVMVMLGDEDDFFAFPTTAQNNPPLSAAERYELTARRVAQWAINVVDFRDSDAIMSPFEYDMRPFNRNGWDRTIDGDPATAEEGDRRVVWGCEYPELLLTETFAMHNRRVRDTKFELPNNGGKFRKPEETENGGEPQPGDPTLDQWRPPEGSLLIEFYSTRGPADINLPAELYIDAEPQIDTVRYPNNKALHMNRTDDGGKGKFPLWRIVISEAHHQAAIDERGVVSPLEQQLAQPDSVNYDPEYRSLLKVAPPLGPVGNQRQVKPLDADRIIWLSSTRPSVNNPDYGRIYYGPNANAPRNVDFPLILKPSQYGVLMPRGSTHISNREHKVRLGDNLDDFQRSGNKVARTRFTPSTGYTAFAHGNNPFRYVDFDGVVHGVESVSFDHLTIIYDGSRELDEAYQTAQARSQGFRVFAAVADPPLEWENFTREIDVSITEPHPNNRPGTPPHLIDEYYPDAEYRIANEADKTVYQRLKRQPLSKPIGNQRFEVINDRGQAYDEPFERVDDANARNPLSRDKLVSTGTTENYKTAFLQRLANPLLPWNARPLDGLGQPSRDHDPAKRVNPYITVDWMPIDVTVYNGDEYSGIGNDQPPQSFWDEPGPYDPDEVDGKVEAEVIFGTRERGSVANGPAGQNNLWAQHSVRPTLSEPSALKKRHFGRKLLNTLGFINKSYLAAGEERREPEHYRGSPPTPFPWLTWNNRPFAGHLELLLVPTSAPSRLAGEISIASKFGGANPYGSTQGNNTSWSFHTPFGHLLNFFHSTTVGSNNKAGADLSQLLDYVEVPSRFVESETWYNPKAIGPSDPAALGLTPPLNHVSRFRDPGRVNINTISDPRVWQAITRLPVDGTIENGIDDVSWKDLADSRRGYEEAATNSPLRHLDHRYPTQFGNPFRTATSAQAMPLLPTTAAPDDPRLKQPSADATLLRSDSLSDDANKKSQPLLAYQSTNLYNHTDRNAHFRYDGLQRLANSVTNHSNLFAVWITVGYFEVEPVPKSRQDPQVYPDDLWLGQELGNDTGESKRHRAFYLIDRSIPVAYERGKNHNVDRAVTLRRFIE